VALGEERGTLVLTEEEGDEEGDREDEGMEVDSWGVAAVEVDESSSALAAEDADRFKMVAGGTTR
jgi:hypothetical protein